MTNKDTLLSYVNHRSWNVTNESETFLWARTVHTDDVVDKNLGGGNFLITMGAFATLSYLAKIYALLRGVKVFDRNEEAGIEFQKLTCTQKELFTVKQNGQIDETQAFEQLIKDSPVEGLGLKEDDIVPAYKDIRHKLVHMISPKEGTILWTTLISSDFEEFKNKMKTDGSKAFRYKDDRRDCDVDRLNRDVSIIREWLAGKIINGEFDGKIDYTLAWIEKTLGAQSPIAD